MCRTEIFISTAGPFLTGRIDHVLRDRRWHTSILDVCLTRGADCDTDHYLVIAKRWGKIGSK